MSQVQHERHETLLAQLLRQHIFIKRNKNVLHILKAHG